MRRRWAWGCLLLLWLGGCLGRSEFTPVHYYSIDGFPAAVRRAQRSWPVMLGVQPFVAASRYCDRILYRLSEVEVGFYEYHRWVEPPAEMVTRVAREMLRASGLFREVTLAEDVRAPAWLLSGELLRFDEVHDAQGTHAECWLRVELHRARDGAFLWSALLQAAVPQAAETPAALARAMTRAVQQVVMDLIARLERLDLPREER